MADWFNHPDLFTLLKQSDIFTFRSFHDILDYSPANLVLLKIRPINLPNLSINPAYVDLSLGRMHYISTLGTVVCYVFELPKLYTRVLKNYIKVIQPNYKAAVDFNNVKCTFSNKDLAVYNSEDKALLITSLHREFIRSLNEG